MTSWAGLDRVAQTLHAGRAVVLPNPSPLTYVVAATSPQVVNAAKQRPPTQEVAVWVRGDEVWDQVAPLTRLPAPDRARALDLLRNELVTALVPVHEPDVLPPWLRPAVRDGFALLFGTLWEPLGPALAEFPRLYVSSANRTGHPPAPTARDASTMFGPDCLVVDGDEARDPSVTHHATTTVRVGADGALELVRSGATDEVVAHVPVRDHADFPRGKSA